MSEVNRMSSPRSGTSSGKTSIWQRDELLLVLKCTSRCLPLEDMVKFVDFLESVLPSEKIIKFPTVSSISKQLEQMVKTALLEKRGGCYRLAERGVKFADEAELSMETDEEVDTIWHAARNALVNLPSNRLMWDSHLFSALKEIKGE